MQVCWDHRCLPIERCRPHDLTHLLVFRVSKTVNRVESQDLCIVSQSVLQVGASISPGRVIREAQGSLRGRRFFVPCGLCIFPHFQRKKERKKKEKIYRHLPAQQRTEWAVCTFSLGLFDETHNNGDPSLFLILKRSNQTLWCVVYSIVVVNLDIFHPWFSILFGHWRATQTQIGVKKIRRKFCYEVMRSDRHDRSNLKGPKSKWQRRHLKTLSVACTSVVF